MSLLRALPIAVLAVLLPRAADAGEASTVRIETHAYYGATITLEQGVRVYRPLPPHSRVIINPGGMTPVHLGIEDNRSTSENHYYDHGIGDRGAHYVDPGHGIVGGFVGHQKFHRSPKHHHHSKGSIGVSRGHR